MKAISIPLTLLIVYIHLTDVYIRKICPLTDPSFILPTRVTFSLKIFPNLDRQIILLEGNFDIIWCRSIYIVKLITFSKVQEFLHVNRRRRKLNIGYTVNPLCILVRL
jgi:hypothetical protein